MICLDDLVAVGRFSKTHGVSGEVNVDLDVDIDLDACDCFIVEMDGIPVPFFLEGYRYRSDRTVIVEIDGVESDEGARKFFGKAVYVEPQYIDRESASEADAYLGYMLVDESGREIGRITAVDDSTANVLFVVDDILIPVAAIEVVECDDKARRITVVLPDGLLDLQ